MAARRKERVHVVDLYYSAHELGELLGIHENTVLERAKREEIPGKKVGGRWRFLRAEIDDWLARRGAPKAPPPPVTQEQLRQVIREELKAALAEIYFVPVQPGRRGERGVA
ncbi:MAG: helix-turn-helix domain-containing protein [Chloroflexota bacterium]